MLDTNQWLRDAWATAQEWGVTQQFLSAVGLAPPPEASLGTAAQTTLTGVQYDELARALFGKDIPIFVGGDALIGGRIIEGPFITMGGSPSQPLASFIVSVALAANPTGTREITSMRLNGTESWTSLGGSLISGMSVNVKTGSETQTPFASSISRYGDRAIAYRPHILVEIQNCPLASFNNIIPFVSAYVSDSSFGSPATGISRNDALTVLARYARYDDSEFSFDVSGTDRFWIVAQNTQFIPFLQQMRRIFRKWNIVASDALQIFESDLTTTDLTITRAMLAANSLRFRHSDPLSIPRQRGVRYIDVNRDNDFNVVTERLERFPQPLTASQSSEVIELPIGSDEDTMGDEVSQSLQIDDIARKQISGSGLTALLGLESGDMIAFADDDNIAFRGIVTEVARNHDMSVDFKAEAAV
jgi:hypothetical protein